MTLKQAERHAVEWWKEVMGVPKKDIDQYDLQETTGLIFDWYHKGHRDAQDLQIEADQQG
mgnify:CR=1 FL=1